MQMHHTSLADLSVEFIPAGSWRARRSAAQSVSQTV